MFSLPQLWAFHGANILDHLIFLPKAADLEAYLFSRILGLLSIADNNKSWKLGQNLRQEFNCCFDYRFHRDGLLCKLRTLELRSLSRYRAQKERTFFRQVW